MSSVSSRKRQRRGASVKLARVERALTDRKADLAAYEHVLADLTKHYREGRLSPFSGAQVLSVVETFRNVTRTACEKLEADVAELAKACPKSTSDPRKTLGA